MFYRYRSAQESNLQVNELPSYSKLDYKLFACTFLPVTQNLQVLN